MALNVGDPAPPFEAPDQNGDTVRSEDYAGKRHVLYFYPHDHTMICTREACSFEAQRDELEAMDVPVIGVSANSVKSHAAFAKNHALGFRLLADPERRIVKAYDAEALLGRIARITYIIGKDGRIEAVRKAELSGKGHAEWAKRKIAELQKEAPATAH